MQIERHKRGASVLNFFPSQVADFWIVCPEIERQTEIAGRCRAELETMDAQRDEVQSLRNQIDQLIMDAIVA